MTHDHFWLGLGVIFLSGALNGSFALPMKYAERWRWENTWLTFTFLSLLLLPWVLAMALVPGLSQVYRDVPGRTFLYPLAFGFLWGIAQATFGLGIRLIGMAVAFAVVAGLSSLSGSLVPVLVLNPADILRPRGILLLASMPILFLGLVLYGKAGRAREKEQSLLEKRENSSPQEFRKGLGICIFTGVFGSNINLGFAFSGDILRKSFEVSANPITSTYAVWSLVLTAGFIPNFIYCLRLLFRNHSWHLFRAPGWRREAVLATMMALLWLAGIEGYGIGATLVGRYGTSLGFALFIAVMILTSNLLGVLMGEWKATSGRTRRTLVVGMIAVLVSLVILSFGGVF